MSFDKDLWDGFEATADRMKTGKTFTKEMAIYFKKRAALERDYAKKKWPNYAKPKPKLLK